MEKKSNVVIIIMAILILGLCGIICYLLLNKDENNLGCSIPNNNENNEIVKVEDGIEYVDAYYKKISVKLPKITSTKSGAISLNEKMAEDTIAHTYKYGDAYSEWWISTDETVDIRYEYEIKNDVIALYISTIGHEDGMGIPASGDGHYRASYFYDIKNDKELNISKALPLMGYTTADLVDFNITSFEQLESDGYSHYEIKNGNSKIIFTDCREGCI